MATTLSREAIGKMSDTLGYRVHGVIWESPEGPVLGTSDRAVVTDLSEKDVEIPKDLGCRRTTTMCPEAIAEVENIIRSRVYGVIWESPEGPVLGTSDRAVVTDLNNVVTSGKVELGIDVASRRIASHNPQTCGCVAHYIFSNQLVCVRP